MAIQINFSEAGINVVSKNITSIKNTNNESFKEQMTSKIKLCLKTSASLTLK